MPSRKSCVTCHPDRECLDEIIAHALVHSFHVYSRVAVTVDGCALPVRLRIPGSRRWPDLCGVVAF